MVALVADWLRTSAAWLSREVVALRSDGVVSWMLSSGLQLLASEAAVGRLSHCKHKTRVEENTSAWVLRP